jgi:hypothetical protein
MSATAPLTRQEFKPFTAEERASFLAYRFGSTLDWSTQILVGLSYPAEELRWFVDAVQGICKGKERRIAHATLATRAQRFKNPSQAKSLVKRAIEANNEWARIKQRMVFDIEVPKPHEREGKDKRARTKYTDYLTPAAVWAQEAEHRVKKSDELRWKKDAKYRVGERRKILAAAVSHLPGFDRVEDMPAGAQPKEKQPLELSAYVEQREQKLLAENRRVLDKLCDGELIDVDEIDGRLAALEVFYSHVRGEVEKSFESARDVLLGLRKTRCARAMNLSLDPLEVVSEMDEMLETKGVAHVPLSNEEVSGNDSSKGNTGVPLSVVAPEKDSGDFEEVVIEDSSGSSDLNDESLSQLDCALSYASLGLPVFPTKPNKSPYTPRGFKDATTDPEAIRAWWRQWPDAGIGIPTGKSSGWLVLDIDPRHGGDATLTALVEEHDDLPTTAHATTPTGGSHFFFKYPSHVEIGNSAGKLGKGLDVRGEGGYVVAPGRDSSRRWTNALDPAEAPDWMTEALLSEKHEPVNTDRKVLHYPFASARYFEEGERNMGLRDVACGRWIHGYAVDENDLYQQLREVRDTRCAPGKDSPATDTQLMDLARRTARKYQRGTLRQEGARV